MRSTGIIFRKRRMRVQNDEEAGFSIIGEDTSFAVREAYKVLRTNVMFSLAAAERGKLIGVTSSVPGEGKSTSAVNLAISMAQTGKKILLLDCDLRLSTIASRLKLPASPGLSNVLVGLVSAEETVQKTENFHMDVIVAGDVPPNPTELLESAQMAELYDALAERYDYIIADLPPVELVSDALIVSKYLDGIILTVREDYSERDGIKDTVRQLRFVDAKLLGFIFNDHAVRHGSKYGRYGKYGKYGRYGKYGVSTGGGGTGE